MAEDEDDRPSVPLGYATPAGEADRPLWNDVVVATVSSLVSAVILPAGISGWWAQVFGDADVGGFCVWVLLILAFTTTWQSARRWRIVWRKMR